MPPLEELIAFGEAIIGAVSAPALIVIVLMLLVFSHRIVFSHKKRTENRIE